MNLTEFIDKVGRAAISYYPKYKILPSLCIAQALLESNKDKYNQGKLKLSGLAADCHNYFGMKWIPGCRCGYKEYSTREQRKDGSYYTVVAKFRKYPSLEDGIKGYFDFLNYPRYANLKGVTDYKVACNLIRQDGWATSLDYTNNLIARIEFLHLDNYDKALFGGSIPAPVPTPTPIIQNGMNYIIGRTYTLDANLFVRDKDGNNILFEDLTENAKANGHISESKEGGYAVLDKGTRVTCKGILKKSDGTWMQIPSGYICAIANDGTVYVK